MAMCVDVSDLVMVTNVYGMSQCADGGIIATKSYISGSNYIRKMTDYSSGDWEEMWTALYWNFVATHRTLFDKNQRLSMMPRLFDKMNPDKKSIYMHVARKYLSS